MVPATSYKNSSELNSESVYSLSSVTIPPPPIPRPPPHARQSSSGPGPMHPGPFYNNSRGFPGMPPQSPNRPMPGGPYNMYNQPSPGRNNHNHHHHMVSSRGPPGPGPGPGPGPHMAPPPHFQQHPPPPSAYPPQHHRPPQSQQGPPPPQASRSQHNPPPQPRQPSQKPKYPSSGLNGNWQSDKDMTHRREMIQHIVQLLKQKDKHASKEWLNKLPQMVKQLEVSLYRSAPSFEAYADLSTLKHRLQLLAIEIAKNTQPSSDRKPSSSSSNNNNNNNNRQQLVHMDDINPTMNNNSNNNNNNNNNNSSSNNSTSSRNSSSNNDTDMQMRIHHKRQRLLLLHHSSKCQQGERCTTSPYCADMKRLWKHMSECSDTNCRVKHCYSSRSILRHYRMCKDTHCAVCEPVRKSVRESKNNSSTSSQSQNNTNTNSTSRPQSQSSTNGMYSNDNRYSNKHSSLDNAMTMPDPIAPNNHNHNQPYNMQNQQHQQQQQPYYDNRYDNSNRPPSSASQISTSHSPAFYDRDSQSNNDNNSQYSRSQPPSSSQSDRSNDSEWQNRIKHKRQRLLLLRHASKCTVEGECRYTPHCANMKRIWKHISDCKHQNCKVQHCLSSRYLLSHYRRCKDTGCPVCEPVRKIIRESAEREKLKKLKEQQQQQQQQQQQHRNSSDPLDHSHHSDGPHDSSSSSRHASAREPLEDNLSDNLSPSRMFYDSQEPQKKKARTASDSNSIHRDSFRAIDNASPSNRHHSLSPAISHSDLSPPTLPPPEQTQTSQHHPPPNIQIQVPQNVQVPTTVASASNNTLPEPTPSSSSSSHHPPSTHSQTPLPTHHTSLSTNTPQPVTPKPGDDNNYSLIHSFTVEQIQTHIDSLRTQLPLSKLKSRCLEILKGLQTSPHGWVFNAPVDPIELGLPDYFDIIKKPMDLGTIHKKIDVGSYHNLTDFCNDVRLVFDNAMTYNEQGSVVHEMAKELQAKFNVDYDKLLEQLKIEGEERRKNEKACNLCGCERLLFEPPTYFCNGLNCQSQRIRRNSHYYVGGNNQYYWCNQCYNDLDENAKIEMVDLTLQKSDLTKKKNDEVHEESWVFCDTCECWIHQICGLFNSRQNKDQSEYSCPSCLLNNDKISKNKSSQDKIPSADDLPRTKLSEWLENHVRGKVDEHQMALAKEKSESEHMELNDAMKAVNIGGPITIRQVTSTDRKLEVRERMKKRYAHKNYPSEFPFRCKCIVVFQNLDGVDVLLFALYVYEHGEDNPPPNQRTVYISYLDSVHFMRPRKLRTFVYHEILIAYLDYARRKGFATAHIWACPPLKGDDYIFYAKPEDQKTPKDSRLRQWYIDMLIECQKRDIVGKMTNMHDLYFSNAALDATAVPYMEGDYFPGEAENIIKDIEEGRNGKSGTSGKKSKKKKSSSNGNGGTSKSKNKSKTGRKGTRSAGMEDDGETPVISGDSKDKTVVENTRDPVMAKLGEIISPMKESFIVAYLNWSGARQEDMVVPKEILDYRANVKMEDDQKFPDPVSSSVTGKKRDNQGKPRVVSSDSMACRDSTDRHGNPLKIIDDDLEELDCEFFNNRQSFLNLCRGNHYQFDELRRAKHTSMMVLWHLHNRHADKFVQQCSSCSREILSGTRYHCNVCPGFDLCEECYKNPNANRGSCTHQLQASSVDGESKGAKGGSGSQLTEAQRKDRQRNIKLHIQLIEHASRCNNPKCASSNCAKMKQYLKHAATCKLKATGGCKICKRIWTLLRIHAQQCKVDPCPIPQCMFFRERLRQLAKQQQAMDDRRRQEMNRHYRMANANG